MSPVSLLLNILWIVLGGAWMAFGWLIALSSWRSRSSAFPGRGPRSTSRPTPCSRSASGRCLATPTPGQEDIGTGPLGLIGNIIWLVLAGWWLALAHVVTAVVLAVTIIGIPFAWAHLKLAGIALWPIGKIIVPA